MKPIDMVIIIVRQHQQIRCSDLFHLLLHDLSAPFRSSIDQNHSPMASLLAFNDKRVSVIDGYEMYFAHNCVVSYCVSA